MKTILITISSAIFFTGMVVACAAPTTGPSSKSNNEVKKGNNKDTDKDTDKNTDDTPTKTPTKTPTPTATGSTGADAGTSGSLAQGDACTLACLGSDTAAIQIMNADQACGSKCNEQNFDQCQNQCGESLDQACQSNPAACQKLTDCDTKCFGGTSSSSGTGAGAFGGGF